jgi:chromate transporter
MNLNKQLFLTFLKIGGFTIGGGYAMIPLMEKEIVEKQQWMSREEFLDIMAVAQSTPGIFAIDMASHVGYKLGGLRSALWSILGTVLPSLVIILLVAFFFQSYQDNPYVVNAFRGIRPVVVSLIASPVFKMAKSAKITLKTCWIPVVSALLIWGCGVSPIYIILVACIAGYLYGRSSNHKKSKQA